MLKVIKLIDFIYYYDFYNEWSMDKDYRKY